MRTMTAIEVRGRELRRPFSTKRRRTGCNRLLCFDRRTTTRRLWIRRKRGATSEEGKLRDGGPCDNRRRGGERDREMEKRDTEGAALAEAKARAAALGRQDVAERQLLVRRRRVVEVELRGRQRSLVVRSSEVGRQDSEREEAERTPVMVASVQLRSPRSSSSSSSATCSTTLLLLPPAPDRPRLVLARTLATSELMRRIMAPEGRAGGEVEEEACVGAGHSASSASAPTPSKGGAGCSGASERSCGELASACHIGGRLTAGGAAASAEASEGNAESSSCFGVGRSVDGGGALASVFEGEVDEEGGEEEEEADGEVEKATSAGLSPRSAAAYEKLPLLLRRGGAGRAAAGACVVAGRLTVGCGGETEGARGAAGRVCDRSPVASLPRVYDNVRRVRGAGGEGRGGAGEMPRCGTASGAKADGSQSRPARSSE